MFVYSWLNLAGFDLPMEEVKNFRQHHSMTPGHPEFPNSEHNTPGIECTTGPLGQGIANAAGFAASEKMAAARFNTADHKIFDHHVFALCGDGCIQEGVSHEAACFAAHEKVRPARSRTPDKPFTNASLPLPHPPQLDNLIVLYDSNDVTLDKMADYTQSEDVGARYEAIGWDVKTIDGHDIDAVTKAIADSKASKNGKPTMIICRTVIGKGESVCEDRSQATMKSVYNDDSSSFATRLLRISLRSSLTPFARLRHPRDRGHQRRPRRGRRQVRRRLQVRHRPPRREVVRVLWHARLL